MLWLKKNIVHVFLACPCRAPGTMLSMQEQSYYIQDKFGLRTLDESGRLQLVVVPNVT